MDDVQSIIQYAQLVGSTLGPEALNAGLNSRRAAVRIGDLMGLPIEVLQTPEEVAAQQQAQAEAAQQEALLQSPAVAQIAGNATKPQEPAPSPMT
jgi:hypothetical protein